MSAAVDSARAAVLAARRAKLEAEIALEVAQYAERHGCSEGDAQSALAERAGDRLTRAAQIYRRAAERIADAKDEQRRAIASVQEAAARTDALGYVVVRPQTRSAVALFEAAGLEVECED